MLCLRNFTYVTVQRDNDDGEYLANTDQVRDAKLVI